MEALVVHRGFGNKSRVVVSGHVFKRYSAENVSRYSGVLKTIWANFKRYINQPAPSVEVHIAINNEEHVVTTDKRGYFSFDGALEHSAIGWHEYRVRVPELSLEQQAEYKVCDEESTGVISDIDDTLLVSHSSIDWRKLYTYLSKSTARRKPTELLNEVFGRLSEYNDGVGVTDYFYVSNSEWNLYEFLIAFFDLHEIPRGIYLLNTIINNPLDFIKRQGKSEVAGHKLQTLHFLFDLFPKKQFVLMGDTAQHDVQLFERIIVSYRKRVAAVLLREVKEKHLLKYQTLEALCKKEQIDLTVFK